MTITWKNVTAGNNGSELTAIGDAGKNISRGITQIGSSLENFASISENKAEQGINTRALSVKNSALAGIDNLREQTSLAEDNDIISDIDLTSGSAQFKTQEEYFKLKNLNPTDDQSKIKYEIALQEGQGLVNNLTNLAKTIPSEKDLQRQVQQQYIAMGKTAAEAEAASSAITYDINAGRETLTDADKLRLDRLEVEYTYNTNRLNALKDEETRQHSEIVNSYADTIGDPKGSPAEVVSNYLNKFAPADEDNLEDFDENKSEAARQTLAGINNVLSGPDREGKFAEVRKLTEKYKRNGVVTLPPGVIQAAMGNLPFHEDGDLNGVFEAPQFVTALESGIRTYTAFTNSKQRIAEIETERRADQRELDDAQLNSIFNLNKNSLNRQGNINYDNIKNGFTISYPPAKDRAGTIIK